MQQAATLDRPRARPGHQNDNHPAMEPETHRARIIRTAEAASRDSDISEFAESYGIKPFA